MYVVIIKGNPKFINTPVARQYYKAIEKFLYGLGVKRVDFDPGADYTCPPKADFYVAHSRGVGRVDLCKHLGEHNALKFGSLDGIIHPTDAEWQKVTPAGTGTPPKEHFLFTPEQQQAIRHMYERVRATQPKSSEW